MIVKIIFFGYDWSEIVSCNVNFIKVEFYWEGREEENFIVVWFDIFRNLINDVYVINVLFIRK